MNYMTYKFCDITGIDIKLTINDMLLIAALSGRTILSIIISKFIKSKINIIEKI